MKLLIYRSEFLVRLSLLLAVSFTKMLESRPISSIDNTKKKENDQLRVFYLHDRGTPTLVQNHNLLERKVRIYSKASGHHIRIMARKIDSLGTEKSQDSILIIESVGFAVIRIKSATSDFYLCMNKKGNLVGRRNSMTSPKCMFVVEDDNPFAYMKYVSLANPKNRISFNKNGNPRQANRVPSSDHRSVLFMERPVMDNNYYSLERRKREEQAAVLPSRRDPCKNTNQPGKQDTSVLSRLQRLYCAQRRQEQKRKKSKPASAPNGAVRTS